MGFHAWKLQRLMRNSRIWETDEQQRQEGIRIDECLHVVGEQL